MPDSSHLFTQLHPVQTGILLPISKEASMHYRMVVNPVRKQVRNGVLSPPSSNGSKFQNARV